MFKVMSLTGNYSSLQQALECINHIDISVQVLHMHLPNFFINKLLAVNLISLELPWLEVLGE